MAHYNFKVGDKVRFKNEAEHQEYRNCIGLPQEFTITKIETDKHELDYWIAFDENCCGACFYRLELVEAEATFEIIPEFVPVEKILVVNKVRPEYTTYIENTKDEVLKYFIGTRLFDFYVIKNGEMIELNSDKDVVALYEVPKETMKDSIMNLKYKGDKVQIEGCDFQLGCDPNEHGKTWLRQAGTGYEFGKTSVYLKRKGETNAWYTLKEFVDMLEIGNYYFD